jgi:hypothetical protein
MLANFSNFSSLNSLVQVIIIPYTETALQYRYLMVMQRYRYDTGTVPTITISYVTDITVPYPTYPGNGSYIRVPELYGTACSKSTLLFWHCCGYCFSFLQPSHTPIFKTPKNIRYSNYHGALWSCIPTKYKLVKKGKYRYGTVGYRIVGTVL